MIVGERHYKEVTLATYADVMRRANVTSTRRAPELQDRVFSTSLFTAVSASKASDVRYLVCLERVA